MNPAPSGPPRQRFSGVAVSGLAAALVGWAAEGYDLLGPTYATATCTTSGRCAQSTESLVKTGLASSAALFLGLVALLLLLLLIGAVLARDGRRAASLAALVPGVAGLLTATLLTALSVGATLLPADGLAVLTLIMAVRLPRAFAARSNSPFS